MKKMLIAAGVMYLCTMPGFAQTTPSTTTSGGSDSMKSDTMKQDSNSSGNMSGDMDNMKGKKHKKGMMGMGMGKEKTMTGCVEASGDEYMLKMKHGKSMEIMSTEDLKPHIGHTVKVTGMMNMGGEKAEGAMKSGSSDSSMSGGKMEKQFKVTKMEMVSETCMMNKMGKKMKNSPTM